MEKQSEKFRTITVEELRKMVEVDQDMRNRSFDEWDKSIDHRNTARMKEIIEEIGWPSISKLGKEGSSNAWLLVQHADHDPEFQKKCLGLMKSEPEGEIDKANIAYLEDRVAVADGNPQIYGTQFYRDSDGHMQPRPIVDPENIEQRRKEMGLETFAEYQESMLEIYDRNNT